MSMLMPVVIKFTTHRPAKAADGEAFRFRKRLATVLHDRVPQPIRKDAKTRYEYRNPMLTLTALRMMQRERKASIYSFLGMSLRNSAPEIFPVLRFQKRRTMHINIRININIRMHINMHMHMQLPIFEPREVNLVNLPCFIPMLTLTATVLPEILHRGIRNSGEDRHLPMLRAPRHPILRAVARTPLTRLELETLELEPETNTMPTLSKPTRVTTKTLTMFLPLLLTNPRLLATSA
mmetsp:Transcript_3803/g.8531  ORF Transcript_3803/g.8531 Transcript_3803/m.8531 type:complete len:236 (+) Transcript_3803:250-957(+)